MARFAIFYTREKLLKLEAQIHGLVEESVQDSFNQIIKGEKRNDKYQWQDYD